MRWLPCGDPRTETLLRRPPPWRPSAAAAAGAFVFSSVGGRCRDLHVFVCGRSRPGPPSFRSRGPVLLRNLAVRYNRVVPGAIGPEGGLRLERRAKAAASRGGHPGCSRRRRGRCGAARIRPAVGPGRAGAGARAGTGTRTGSVTRADGRGGAAQRDVGPGSAGPGAVQHPGMHDVPHRGRQPGHRPVAAGRVGFGAAFGGRHRGRGRRRLRAGVHRIRWRKS